MMKSYQLILIALVVACASAFAPVAQQRTAVSQLAAAKMPETPEASFEHKKAVAMTAFATAVTPLAANAVDEGVIIGYGAGLVACVVSLAVGFAIGYGTLVKP